MKTLRRLSLALATLAVPAAIGVSALAADHGADADNTKRNVEDRDSATITPLDQGGSQADRTITQQIRKAVVAHDGLSVNAKNSKIMTIDGVVTLRGPVKTDHEKAAIGTVAQKTAGVKRVDNELEVERDR